MARIPCAEARELLKELKLNQRDLNDQFALFRATGDEKVSSRMDKMRERQEIIVAELYDQLPIGRNFEKAKEIMGDSFYGAGETKIRLDWSAGFKDSDMGPIPFSPQELREAKEQKQYLIHRFSKDAFDDQVDAHFIRMNAPDRLESKRWLEGLYSGIEKFQLEHESLRAGWFLSQLKTRIPYQPNAPQPVVAGHTILEFYYDGIVTNDFIRNAEGGRESILILTKSKAKNGAQLQVMLSFKDPLHVESGISLYGTGTHACYVTSQRSS